MDFRSGYFSWRGNAFPAEFCRSGEHPYIGVELLHELPSGEALPVRHDILWLDLDSRQGEAITKSNGQALLSDDGDDVRTYEVFFPGNLIVRTKDV